MTDLLHTDQTTHIANSWRYAVSEGISKAPTVMVLAASRLPPTALASDVPMLRARVFRPFAAAISWTGVCSLISVGIEA